MIPPIEENQEEEDPKEAEEQPPPHSHLGDKEGEEKIREYVEELM